jgi:hypothetical protein
MIGLTGVPTGLSPTAGVDYSIPLPYDVPPLATNRVGYYFAASTLGDAYRRAVNGDPNWFAWIQAAATMDDAHFALAFPPQAGLEQLRSWFQAAYVGLKAPGGSSVTAIVTTTPEGAASITSAPAPLGVPLEGAPPESPAANFATNPGTSPVTVPAKDVLAAQIAPLNPGPTGVLTGPTPAPAAAAAAPMTMKPSWLWWAVGIVAAFLLLSWLGRRS